MDHTHRRLPDLDRSDHSQATVITTRRVVLVLLVLACLVLFVLMITDKPASAYPNLPMNGGIVPAGGIALLATICSIGGFLVGGGTVYLYAKATDQTIYWRGVPGIGWLLRQKDRGKEEDPSQD